MSSLIIYCLLSESANDVNNKNDFLSVCFLYSGTEKNTPLFKSPLSQRSRLSYICKEEVLGWDREFPNARVGKDALSGKYISIWDSEFQTIMTQSH